MTGLNKFFLWTLGLGAPSAAGVYYLLEYINQPRNFSERLLRDGKSPIASTEDAKWRAKFSDFGAEMRDKVTGVTNVEDTNNAEQINGLKGWCDRESKKANSEEGYENYSRFCSTELRTLKGKMISDGLVMASSEDDWKTIFLNHRHDADFLAKVNGAQTASTTLTSSSKASEAHDKISQYCATLLNVEYSGENHVLAQKWCVQSGIKTIGERLSSLSGFSKPSEEDYGKIVEKWKDNETFKNIALKDQTSGTGGDKDKLKNYCEGEFAKTLVSLNDSYDVDMKNIYNFCNGTLPEGDVSNLREIVWQS